MKTGTLLVVDDNKSILTSVEMLLNNYFNKVITLCSPNSLHSLLRKEQVDVVLLDMNFKAGINSGNEGLHWLREIRQADPTIGVVLFTAYADIELAVNGIKEGAADFVVKPWENSRLVQILTTVRDQVQKQRKGERVQKLDAEESMSWGVSPAMAALRRQIERFSTTDANVLITGENGTGKEMLAREIHRLSLRARRAWVSVDMGALTDTLFESELFGHNKGAFTDAREDRIGRFEAADGGTIFLDEIGNLPYHQQAKLLTVLQQRQVIRVGSNYPIPVDIRLICATNRNLDEMVAAGTFREDLLYRINTLHVQLPPLRERPEDIKPLAERFLKQYAGQYGRQVCEFSATALERLVNHPWYGNIRELQHMVEKAVILSEGSTLEADCLQLSETTKTGSSQAANRAVQPVVTLEENEKRVIADALYQCNGNLSQAASCLGVSRQTLYNKMKRYGL